MSTNETPSDPRFCVDCTYFKQQPSTRMDALCIALPCRQVDLVMGYQNPTCYRARCATGKCGPAAIFYEPRAWPGQPSSNPEAMDAPASLSESAMPSIEGAIR